MKLVLLDVFSTLLWYIGGILLAPRMGDLKVKSFGLRSAAVGEVSKTKKWEMKNDNKRKEKKKVYLFPITKHSEHLLKYTEE